ncbi:MAG TPA: iron-sulfur cluster assembly protein, partial [Planctomycetota bacterium]|nr:iron-sulfur cluster assembly protein [Planctomycetota bacterium]
TQRLGGHVTVLAPNGSLLRIDGADADALGLEPAVTTPVADATASEAAIWAQLRTVYDPEIPVNVADLGLIYSCRLADGHAEIRMTMTAPGCGMGEILREEVRRKVRAIPGIEAVSVELVFEPPWDRSMMSEAARLELGLFG